jgi:hypothetical protein
LFLVGAVTTDRGVPFGVVVTLEQDARVLGADTIRPSDRPGVSASSGVGTYSFYGLTPGDYILVFKYGEHVISRETVVLDDSQISPWRTHLLLSQYPQIPIGCGSFRARLDGGVSIT